MKRLLVFLALAAVLLGLAACQTAATSKTKKTTGEGEMFEVKAEFTPFYRTGPQQRGGPDLSLKRNRLVKMLKRGFGFSQVEVDDGTTGYVATEDLRPSAEEGFTSPDPGLFGLSADPIQSSAIVERYSVGEEPGAPGLQLQTNGPPSTLLFPPDAPLPVADPASAPAPSPSPSPAP
jgi:hypothetical protein